MKTLFLFLVLIIGIFSANTTKAQKIDCSTNPNLPDKLWSVALNPPMDNIADFSKLSYKLIKLTEGSKITNLEKTAQTGLNSCVLDYLIKNPEVIPQDWKGKNILFTRTVFKDGGGSSLYKTLTFQDGTWQWGKSYPEDYIMDNTYQLVLTN